MIFFSFAYFRSIHHAHSTKSQVRFAAQATALIDGGGGPSTFSKWITTKLPVNNQKEIFRLGLTVL